MKDSVSSSLLAALLAITARNGSATDFRDDGPLQDIKSARLMLDNLANAPSVLPALRDDTDWASQLACTADMTSDQPSIIDETACKTATDDSSHPCVWCDIAALAGSGVCVSPDLKTMVGQFWDTLCSNSGSSPAVVTSSPTPPPTPPPVVPEPKPEPKPEPAPDNGGGGDNDWSSQFKCSLDSSSGSIVADETTCTSLADATSSAGQKCVWCNVRLVGGACITNSMKSTVGFMCNSGSEELESTSKNGNLRKSNSGVAVE